MWQVTQSRFVNNSAGLGGAMYASARRVQLRDSRFIGNAAVTDKGGGAFVDSVSDMLIERCIFVSNTGNYFCCAVRLVAVIPSSTSLCFG